MSSRWNDEYHVKGWKSIDGISRHDWGASGNDPNKSSTLSSMPCNGMNKFLIKFTQSQTVIKNSFVLIIWKVASPNNGWSCRVKYFKQIVKF